MQQIKSKVKQITNPSSKKAYQSAIKYLLAITENLLNHKQSSTKQKNKQYSPQYKQRKLYSVGNTRQKNYTMDIQNKKNYNKPHHFQSNQLNQNQQQVFFDCFQGSQLSFIQKINDKINRQQQNEEEEEINEENNNKKKHKLDRRKLQQTIEIYHQCLGRALDVLKKQHCQIIKLIKQQKKSDKIDQFWLKFNNYKNKCKTFDDLFYIVRNLLAQQFLTALKPYSKTIKNISIKLTSLHPRILCIEQKK